MHEYSLMEKIIRAITDQLRDHPLQDGEKVGRICLKIGALDIHSEDSFRQAFGSKIEETPLKGSELELTVEVGSLNCSACGYKGPCPKEEGDPHEELPVAHCPKCRAVVPILGGKGISDVTLVTR